MRKILSLLLLVGLASFALPTSASADLQNKELLTPSNSVQLPSVSVDNYSVGFELKVRAADDGRSADVFLDYSVSGLGFSYMKSLKAGEYTGPLTILTDGSDDPSRPFTFSVLNQDGSKWLPKNDLISKGNCIGCDIKSELTSEMFSDISDHLSELIASDRSGAAYNRDLLPMDGSVPGITIPIPWTDCEIFIYTDPGTGCLVVTVICYSQNGDITVYYCIFCGDGESDSEIDVLCGNRQY